MASNGSSGAPARPPFADGQELLKDTSSQVAGVTLSEGVPSGVVSTLVPPSPNKTSAGAGTRPGQRGSLRPPTGGSQRQAARDMETALQVSRPETYSESVNKFKDETSLKIHVKSKNEFQEYKCNKCDYKCISVDKFKHHIIEKHDANVRNQNFTCNECQSEGTCEAELKKHTVEHETFEQMVAIDAGKHSKTSSTLKPTNRGCTSDRVRSVNFLNKRFKLKEKANS